MRVVVGISDWPETKGEHFDIFEVGQEESDSQAIERAMKAYGSNLECFIEDRPEEL